MLVSPSPKMLWEYLVANRFTLSQHSHLLWHNTVVKGWGGNELHVETNPKKVDPSGENRVGEEKEEKTTT